MRTKRAEQAVRTTSVDLAGSALAAMTLLLTAPLFAVVAVAIKFEDGGPVLFRQERIGRNGRPFTVYKFRTMVPGAEHLGLGLSIAADDDRITRTGAVLRNTSLDELPQLVNILRGEMSLVGPRPTVRSQVERYTAFQRRRLEVKPGLAGWAQVNGRNSISWSRRIEFDVWYVDHRSARLDLLIMARTILVLLRREGMYGDGGVNADLDVAAAAPPSSSPPR